MITAFPNAFSLLSLNSDCVTKLQAITIFKKIFTLMQLAYLDLMYHVNEWLFLMDLSAEGKKCKLSLNVEWIIVDLTFEEIMTAVIGEAFSREFLASNSGYQPCYLTNNKSKWKIRTFQLYINVLLFYHVKKNNASIVLLHKQQKSENVH